jgi:hypothetical protein
LDFWFEKKTFGNPATDDGTSSRTSKAYSLTQARKKATSHQGDQMGLKKVSKNIAQSIFCQT